MAKFFPNNSSVTLRSGLIGLIFSLVVGVGGQHIANVFNAPNFAYTHVPMCLLIPFLVGILFPNIWLKSFAPRYALLPFELLVIFSMGLIASIVPDWAMNWYLMSVITAPRYYASQENQWKEKFFEHLPEWLVLDRETAQGFFEGITPGGVIPWLEWVSPLFWWFSLITTMLFVGACMVVILRKQWVEYERLRFPLCEISTHLIGTESDNNSVWPNFYRTRIFQIGFGISLIVVIYNCLSFWTNWPHIPIMGSDVFTITFGPSYPPLPIRLNIFSLCFAFFINLEILFSLWFFQLLGIFQTGAMNQVGLTSTTLLPGGLVSIQFIGGMIFFVLWGLWMARRHIREVFAHAIGRETKLDDREELFSYRTAIIGLLLGFLYIIFWLHQVGVSLPLGILFLFILYIFYLAMARILAEAGLVMLDLPINANQFTVALVGSANLSVPSLTGMTVSNAFARNWRTFTMIATAHIAWFKGHLEKIAPIDHSNIRGNRSGFFFWMCLAFAISATSSMIYLIYAGYTYGEQTLRGGAIGSLGNGFYSMAIAWIDNATYITGLEVLFLGIGSLMTFLMTIFRYLFYWWPFHPVGFVVAASSPIRIAFLPFLLAWIIQAILLRTGGVRLYQKAQGLFLGILVGYVVGATITYVIDYIWFIDTPHLYENFF